MATENRENDRPETEEDRFAAAVEAERVAKEQAKAPAAATAPQSRDNSADAAATPPQDQPQRPRDESGRFAPTPPPFEGYDKLDPKAREYVDRLRGDHDGLRRKLIRSQNDIRHRDKALREYASDTRKPATQGARATEAPVASRNNPTPTPQQQIPMSHRTTRTCATPSRPWQSRCAGASVAPPLCSVSSSGW